MFKSNFTLIWLLALTFTFSAHAALDGTYTVDFADNVKPNDPEFIKDVSNMTNDVDHLGLITGLKVNVIVVPASNNASFDSGRNIMIPRQMRFENEYGGDVVYKTTTDALAVYAHEYGHAVFDAYIQQAIPEFAEVKRIFNAMSELEVARYKKTLTPAEKEENKKQYKAVYKSLLDNKELLRIVGLTLAYHEVFADAIAVFVTERKNAISEALYNPNIPAWNKYAQDSWESRDFGKQHDLDTWTSNSVHMLFSPLRSQIGREECWPRTEKEKTDKLKFLAKILSEDMKEKNAAKRAPIIADNKALIEKYKTVCDARAASDSVKNLTIPKAIISNN